MDLIVKKDQPPIRGSILFKIAFVSIALITLGGGGLAYVESNVVTKDDLNRAQHLNQVQIDNIKSNYEFHIEQIYEDLREIRNALKAK